MRAFVLILSASLLAAPAAFATEAAGGQAEASDRMVCKASPRANSRIPRKVCRKKSEWDAQAEAAAKDFREVQSRPVTPLCPPSGCG